MLKVLAYLYGKIIGLRNTLYDKGVFDTFDLGARTISVGNITTGGTGKTPLVAYIAEVLATRGEKVCILTRGYGRANVKQRVLVSDGEKVLADAREGGDEPVELAQKFIGKAIVIADRDRVAAAEWALRKFGVTVFVLDDGFQHRKARRDLDIVCIDATNPLGDRLLPAGHLREPTENLNRADVIVIMRGQEDMDYRLLWQDLKHLAPNAGIIEARRTIKRIVTLDDHKNTVEPQQLPTLFAFSGLAQPTNFMALLHHLGLTIAGSADLGDHHRYDQRDIDDVQTQARKVGAEGLITTSKDAVKLRQLAFEIPCYVLEMELRFDEAERFVRLIL